MEIFMTSGSKMQFMFRGATFYAVNSITTFEA